MAQTGIFEEYIIKDLLASRPAATAVTPGTLYGDEDGIIYRSDGTTWEIYTDPGTGGGSGGHVIENEGTPLTARSNLNFVGVGVDVVDDPGNDASVVTVQGMQASANAGSQYAQPAIHFVDGTNTTVTVTNDVINERIDVQIDATGGGVGIGGTLATTQIPYGSAANTVAGNSHLIYNVAGGGGSGGQFVSEIIGAGGAAVGGYGDTGYGGDFEATGAGGWGVYGMGGGAGGRGVVAEMVTATDGVPIEGLAPSGQTGNLLQLAVNNVVKFFVDALGGIFGRYLDLAEGSAPANPAASTDRIYFKSSDHLPYYRNSSGTETALGGGGGMTNPMTTQDDLIIGGSSGTPTRLAKGTDGQVLTVDPTTHHLLWVTPSGGGGGAPTTVPYITAASDGTLSAEVVVPGLAGSADRAGMLGGGSTAAGNSWEFDSTTDPFTWSPNAPAVYDSNTTILSHYYAKATDLTERRAYLPWTPGSGVFDARCKLSLGQDGSSAIPISGLVLADSADTTRVVFEFKYHTTLAQFQTQYWTYSGGSYTSQSINYELRSNFYYLRLTRDSGNNITGWVSLDGLLWTYIYVFSFAITVAKVGVFFQNAGSGTGHLAIDWIRTS